MGAVVAGVANARLEVIALNDDHEVDVDEQLLAQREGATQHRSRGWLVDVASDVQAASAGVVYAAEVVDADQRGVVRLVLELTDPALAEQSTPADVADRPTSMLGDRDQ